MSGDFETFVILLTAILKMVGFFAFPIIGSYLVIWLLMKIFALTEELRNGELSAKREKELIVKKYREMKPSLIISCNGWEGTPQDVASEIECGTKIGKFFLTIERENIKRRENAKRFDNSTSED